MKSRFRQPRIRPPECNPALVLLEPHRDEFCRKREEQDDRLNKPRRNEDGDSGCSATGERISDQLSAGTLQCFQGLGKFTLSNSVGRPVLSAVVCLLVIDWHRFGRWGSDLSPADPVFASTCSCDCDSPDSPLYAVCVRIAVCPNRCRSLGRVPRTPDHAAVGCGVERRGILLSFYNDMSVYGVTDLAAQQRVLERVAEHYRQAHTHPVQVMFYEEENWSVRQGKNGVTFGSRGSEKLIRVASVG